MCYPERSREIEREMWEFLRGRLTTILILLPLVLISVIACKFSFSSPLASSKKPSVLSFSDSGEYQSDQPSVSYILFIFICMTTYISWVHDVFIFYMCMTSKFVLCMWNSSNSFRVLRTSYHLRNLRNQRVG